ncbi:ABC transporter ATP-binding protein [Bosea sp. (in: a-proteobacteria)]|jgi:putative spermidine/putrescine transport system ATP-binding protein|uniref:ABC transporter ATP-binding protein n=1 Tax=Bosea sp. (in: a-proteobacteria) TaxID=1871050 RepID=UPI002DDD740D|nr:ABC transporter ATP-binding protein [Bosea sp. (in: a-proteobacteria)]HEV2508307.1 ABC transporter ATP-binding protein [Bosea sp. (in: a-proteobacteria)]
MAFLDLQNLGKAYGELVAVADFNLAVAKGEFICLLGPSGCGKTTILQMIAGFVTPTKGRILLDGAEISDVRPSKRGLGIMFQSYALFPHMTVAANVAFGLEMRGIPAQERAARVGEALELVQLGHLAERYPRQLSGGQRQRVALARALVIRPPVLLLDEPMGALDAQLREGMQIELRAIQRKVGITTIMVTHDQAEAMTLADRVVLMNKGTVEQVAAPFEMYEHPNGRFTSTFLGKANVFAGAVSGEDVMVGSMRLPMGQASASGDVDYIVRPEKLNFSISSALVRGRVAVRIFLGQHWLYQIETALGLLQLTEPNIGPPGAAEGDEVGLTWSPEHVRVVGRGAAS